MNQTQNYDDVSQYRKSYLDYLHRQSNGNGNSRVQQDEQRLVKRLRRVEKVQAWLSTSTSMSTTAHGCPQSYQKSCAWFLGVPAYVRWRNQRFDSSIANNQDALVGNWQHRVLFVQGKSPCACITSR
jgi:hypothetical protein